MLKKICLAIIASMVALLLASCGEVSYVDTKNTALGSIDNGVFEINFIVDGTFAADENNGLDSFVEQWDKAVSDKVGYPVHINVLQFEHTGYKEAVSRRIIAGDVPDVMIMSADMYKQYQTTGLLWDMSDAFDNSMMKSRVEININDKSRTSDGKMYGFSPYYGNGCLTYIKKSWLDSVGLSIEDIKTFDDYYNMLRAFKEGDPDGDGIPGNTYGVIAAGFASVNDAPYMQYLPEFWQGAYPAFIQDENGVWYDGFAKDNTKEAILRIKRAYEEGLIDPDTVSASTKVARERFWDKDQTGSSGVFTYWAGTWTQTITENLLKNNIDTELLILDPIKEITDTFGGYINREAPVFVIIDDGDGNDERERKIYDVFIDTMLDGDKVQMLWTYGAEDVHWSVKAESFQTVSNAGKENEKITEYNYEEGKFHLRPTPNSPNTIWKKNMIDNALVIAPLSNGYEAASELVKSANQYFVSVCVDAPVGASSESLTENSDAINKAKETVIKAVITENKDIDEAFKELYFDVVGDKVNKVLEELNSSN